MRKITKTIEIFTITELKEKATQAEATQANALKALGDEFSNNGKLEWKDIKEDRQAAYKTQRLSIINTPKLAEDAYQRALDLLNSRQDEYFWDYYFDTLKEEMEARIAKFGFPNPDILSCGFHTRVNELEFNFVKTVSYTTLDGSISRQEANDTDDLIGAVNEEKLLSNYYIAQRKIWKSMQKVYDGMMAEDVLISDYEDDIEFTVNGEVY